MENISAEVPGGNISLFEQEIKVISTVEERYFTDSIIKTLYENLEERGIKILPAGTLVNVRSGFVPHRLNEDYYTDIIQWRVTKDVPIEELKKFYDKARIVFLQRGIEDHSTYETRALLTTESYTRPDSFYPLPDWLKPREEPIGKVRVGLDRGDGYPGELDYQRIPLISLFIPKPFGSLSAKERENVIREKVLSVVPNVKIAVQEYRNEPGYLHFNSSKREIIGITTGTVPALVYEGGLHTKDMHKIHLNIAADKVVEVCQALAKLQEEEASRDKPHHFGFKVLTSGEGYGGASSPPRIVIFPMVNAMYNQSKVEIARKLVLSQSEIWSDDNLDENYLPDFVATIMDVLDGIPDVGNTTYRARYHELHSSYNDGMIEVVRGGTVEKGDGSGRVGSNVGIQN